MNPQPLTLFQSKLTELSESIYSSRVNGPLGQKPYSDSIPTTIDPLKQTFGKKTVKGIIVRSCVCVIVVIVVIIR